MMIQTTKSTILGLGLFFNLLLIGCSQKAFDITEDAYKPIDLKEINGELSGSDPEEMTLALFGTKEPVEGNFSQDVKVLKKEGFKQTVMFTQLNLPDDSVQGIRYQLQFEFDQSIGKWSLTQAGRQQSCRRGNSTTDWTTEQCP
ncbi:MAG: hypothetical protein QNJ64_11100 [Crocosphaera sp.]|nr:hypothetical protein [Crocosphaera sp.]